MMKRRAAPTVGEWQRKSGVTYLSYALTTGEIWQNSTVLNF
jgi:hypothetical protein